MHTILICIVWFDYFFLAFVDREALPGRFGDHAGTKAHTGLSKKTVKDREFGQHHYHQGEGFVLFLFSLTVISS